MLVQVLVEIVLGAHRLKNLLSQLWVESLLGHTSEELCMMTFLLDLVFRVHVILFTNLNCLLQFVKIEKSVLTLHLI